MNFLCIADKESSLGFKLAGLETREVSNKSEAKEAFKVVSSVEDLGVVLITEEVAEYIREEIEAFIYKQDLPLVLEIPSRSGAKSRKSLSDFLKEAVGISM